MIAQDIVDRLSAEIPKHTDRFSESTAIASITVSGATATVTAAAHGVIDGQNVAILGAQAPVQIDVGNSLRVGSSLTIKTLQDHDLTLSVRDVTNGGKTVALSGANEAEFVGVFPLAKVVSRREFIVAVADAGPTVITGQALVDNANGEVFNGLFAASSVTPNTFAYTLPVTYPLSAVTSGATVQTSIRVLSVLDIESYLQDVYTRKAISADVLVVQIGDVTQSKKRNEETDAASSAAGEYAFTPTLLQPFAVYIVQNVTDDLNASRARDRVESEYVPAIFKSVLRARFDTGFTHSQYRATFTGHGVLAYSGVTGKNRAIYAHEVSFEQLAALTSDDAVQPDFNVAMRGVSYTLKTDNGTGVETLDSDIDLDGETI